MTTQPSGSAACHERPGLRADAAKNRDRILSAAALAFAEDGLDVPIDRIAKRAGVGNATLYRRFPTREALVTAVATASVRRLTEVAAAVLEEHGPDGLRVFVASADQLTAVHVLPLLDQEHFEALPAADTTRLRDTVSALVERARCRYPLHPALNGSVLLALIALTTRPLPAPEDRPPTSLLLDVLLHGVCPPTPVQPTVAAGGG